MTTCDQVLRDTITSTASTCRDLALSCVTLASTLRDQAEWCMMLLSEKYSLYDNINPKYRDRIVIKKNTSKIEKKT